MTRSLIAHGLAGLLVGAGLAQVQARAQDQPPPLEPPALAPPVTKPSSARTAAPAANATRVPPAKPIENHSLLVIPGVTAPAPSRPGVRRIAPRTSAGNADALPGLPPVAPLSTNPARTAQTLPRPTPGPPGSIPLSLEAIPDDPPAELGSERSPGSVSSTAPRGAPAPLTSRPAPSGNTSSILGRLLGPSNVNEDLISPGRDTVSVEPHSDPAAEAALKRRIQKQVERTLGDHVRSVEVRIKGRTVVFRARASRFWYRRGVRRALQSMPLPAGYRARVEAVE